MFQTRDESFGTIKYAGRSKAKVLDINDPAGRGRIVVDHPIIGVTGWIPYLTAPGMFSVPSVDDIVYVECDCGFESHPIAWGNLNKGDNSSADSSVNEAFTRIGPTNRGFYTPGGHLIEFDDGSTVLGTDKGIRITTSDGTMLHLKEDPVDQGVLLETSNGQIIEINGLQDTIDITTSGGLAISMDGLADTVDLTANGGTSVSMDGLADSITMASNFGDTAEISKADGIQLSTPAGGGTSISMKGGKVDVQSSQDLTVTSDTGKVEISGGKDITVTSNGGNVEVTAGLSSFKLDKTGTISLTGKTGEIVAILGELLTALGTEAPAGFGAPLVNVAKYIELQTKVQGMTGS